MSSRKPMRRRRVQALIADSPEYLGVFRERTSFTRRGHFEHHRETIRLGRSAVSVAELLANTLSWTVSAARSERGVSESAPRTWWAARFSTSSCSGG